MAGNSPCIDDAHEAVLDLIQGFSEPLSIESGIQGVVVKQVHTIAILPPAEKTH